jgi:hydrogenase-4 membrane subunit HyfE
MTSLAQGAAGVVLVVAFALLGVRQIAAAVVLLVAQAIAVAVATAAQHMGLPALAELAVQALAAPMLLRHLLARLGGSQTTLPIGGTKLAVIAGAVLTVLAMPWGHLGLPLAVTLLALLLVAMRRHPVMQIIGLLAAQNGLVLAAAGSHWTGIYGVVVPVVPLLAGAALWQCTQPERAGP